MHPLKKILFSPDLGILSACTCNDFVINALFRRAKSKDCDFVLIEATSNAVNQFGGYSGLNPYDFSVYVKNIADDYDFDYSKIYLGGDHLGPLPWRNENIDLAMECALDLIKASVKAGYTKLHLDTSMPLLNDKNLDMQTVAKRSAKLCNCALNESRAPENLLFVLGGRSGNHIDKLISPEELDLSYNIYLEEFSAVGLRETFLNSAVAAAVGVGVKYSDFEVTPYSHENFLPISEMIKKHNNFFIEAHATDYQTKENLRQMVLDGIKILKAGPVFTYSLQRALIALSKIEDKLARENEPSDFVNVLLKEMKKNPKHHIDYYIEGNIEEKLLNSFADRSRYYLSHVAVERAINALILNLNSVNIPMELIDTYLPELSEKIKKNDIPPKAFDIAVAFIENTIDDYMYATKGTNI